MQKSPEQRTIDRLWKPSATLRFRENGERGMILEQLFLGIAFGEPTISEWRPVPVVPESDGVQQ